MNRGRRPTAFAVVCVLLIILGGALSNRQQPPPLDLHFARDYRPGTRDRNGHRLGGTEIMSLAAHKGMLWAAVGAVSSWTAPPFRPVPPGSQILVKRTASGAWEVDLDLGLDYLRAASMAAIRFTTDRHARKLLEPVPVLLVVAGARTFRPRAGEVWARNYATVSRTRLT